MGTGEPAATPVLQRRVIRIQPLPDARQLHIPQTAGVDHLALLPAFLSLGEYAQQVRRDTVEGGAPLLSDGIHDRGGVVHLGCVDDAGAVCPGSKVSYNEAYVAQRGQSREQHGAGSE